MESNRAGMPAAPLSPTQVLFAGGFSGVATIKNFSLNLEGKILSSAEVVRRDDRRVLAGGYDGHAANGFHRDRAEQRQGAESPAASTIEATSSIARNCTIPSTHKFVAVGNAMSDRRMFQTATLLLSGKVLIAGGATNLSGETTNSADIYDPASNSFTPATFPMDHQRAAHTATLFTTGPAAGKVLIAGGVGGSSFFFKDSSAELYDPASQQFVLLSSFMNEPRSMQTATLLDDGNVLLAGGFSGTVAVTGGMLSGASGLISNSAETFDPSTGDFTCVGGFNTDTLRCNQSMSVARAAHTATLLATGPKPHRVLITGGIGATDPAAHGKSLSSAELFNPAAAAASPPPPQCPPPAPSTPQRYCTRRFSTDTLYSFRSGSPSRSGRG